MNKTYQEIVDNLTIAIIGPYDEQSLSNIENYKKICKNVLIFMWSDIQPEKVEQYRDKTRDDNSITLYTEKSPHLCDEIKNAMFHSYLTLLPQVKGIKIAAEKCQTEYMIRTRSDESFSDLSAMIEKFSKNTDTVVSSNVVWRMYFAERSKHMGDHTYITDTETIRSVYTDYYHSAFEGFRGTALTKDFYNCEHGACEEFLFDYFVHYGKIPTPISVKDLGEWVISVEGTKYDNKTGLRPLAIQFRDLAWNPLTELEQHIKRDVENEK